MTKSLRGVSPLRLIIIDIKRGVVIMLLIIVTLKTNKERTIHSLITMRANSRCTNVSPEILNNFVVPNMESVDPEINTSLWLCYMKKMTITIKIK